MDDKVFPQMNTLVRVQESTLLSDARKSELSRTESMNSFFKALMSSGFFHYAKPTGFQDLNAALDEEMRGWLSWLKATTPDMRIAEFFELPQIAQNISVFIKEQILGRELPELYAQETTYTAVQLARAMNAKNAETPLDDSIKSTIEEALYDFKIHQSFSRVAFIIKIFCHSALSKLCEQIGDEEIDSFVAAHIDLDLLSVLIQQRTAEKPLNERLLQKTTGGKLRAFILPLFHQSSARQDSALLSTPYASIWSAASSPNSLYLFEVYGDNYLIELCKKAKLEAFGLFPLFAFIYAKLSDIKNVRILAASKQIGATPDEIMERLRVDYEL